MKYYAYIHTAEERGVFYIGKGCGRRAFDMVSNRNIWHKRITKKHAVSVSVIKCSTEKAAFDVERILIKAYKIGNSELVNMTSGGEGQSGWRPDDEYKKRMSEKLKGRIVTEETKMKIGIAHSGRVFSKETIIKMKLADRSYLHERIGDKHPMFNKKHSEETRLKMSIAGKGKKKKRVKCGVCGKEVSVNMLHRYHENNCKFKVYAEGRGKE